MDQPLDFSKSSKLTSELNRPLLIHLTSEMSSIYSDENYLKFREDMLKKKSSEKSRRISSFSPSSSISSSICNQDSSSNSPETSTQLTHHRSISDTPTVNGDSTNSEPSSIESSTPNGLSRKKGKPLPDSAKDDAYWERRRKNNEAAKRSRDARRLKENEIGIRAAYLEQENLKLKSEIAGLRKENHKLRCLLVQNLNGQTIMW